MSELWRTLQILFLGVFAQFQPLDVGQEGVIRTYEILIGGERYGYMAFQIEEAAEEGPYGGFVLLGEVIEDDQTLRWMRAEVATRGSERIFFQAGDADSPLHVDPFTYPEPDEAHAFGFRSTKPFLNASDREIAIAGSADTLIKVAATVYEYDSDNGGGLSVAISESHGVVWAALHQPGTATIEMSLVTE